MRHIIESIFSEVSLGWLRQRLTQSRETKAKFPTTPSESRAPIQLKPGRTPLKQGAPKGRPSHDIASNM